MHSSVRLLFAAAAIALALGAWALHSENVALQAALAGARP